LGGVVLVGVVFGVLGEDLELYVLAGCAILSAP
jgi:hypothetical protein